MKHHITLKDYIYDGPVYHFEEYLWDDQSMTRASSKEKALNNLRWKNMQRYISEFGLDPSRKYSISLDETCLDEVLDEIFEEDQQTDIYHPSNQLSLFDDIEESSNIESAINFKAVTTAIKFILPILLDLLDEYWDSHKSDLIKRFVESTIEKMPEDLDDGEIIEIEDASEEFADEIYNYIRSIVDNKLKPELEANIV